MGHRVSHKSPGTECSHPHCVVPDLADSGTVVSRRARSASATSPKKEFVADTTPQAAARYTPPEFPRHSGRPAVSLGDSGVDVHPAVHAFLPGWLQFIGLPTTGLQGGADHSIIFPSFMPRTWISGHMA